MRKMSLAMEVTLEKMERFYSRKYGLANTGATSSQTPSFGIDNNNHYTIGNMIPIYTSWMTAIDANYPGGGVSIDSVKSRIKAFGEFIERQLCISDDFAAAILFDSYDNLTNKGYICLDLKDLIAHENHLYDDPSFPFPRYDSSCKIYWIQGIDSINGAKTWLPAQVVLFGYSKHQKEAVYTIRLSTGLACGSNFYQAALGAVHEVIERDSFMLTWHLQIPGVRIEIDNCQNSALAELYAHMCKHIMGEDRLYVYDISKTDGVYTILSFIRNDLPNAYGLIVSAATHTDPETAVLKALEELCQCQQFAYHSLMGEHGKKYQRMDVIDIDELHKHFFYYSTGIHSKNINFISEGNKHIKLSKMQNYATGSDENNLAYLIHLFRQNNQPLYITDITNTITRIGGFFVLKAVIPGYVDLEVTQQYRQLKYSRLQKYKELLERTINCNPHPFP